jgi:phospholipase C
MFETPQGPGQPSHQYLFAATSAPTASDDAAGVFASGDVSGTSNPGNNYGCISPSGFTVHLIDPSGKETQNVYPCFEHATIPDLLPAGFSWRYYAPSYPGLWNAPLAIEHICESTGSSGQCAGPDYINNVDLNPPDVLKDIANCNLRSLSWVIPNPRSSDKPVWNDGSGPKWVSSVVNAVGASTACDGGAGYWLNTAILITWDMWAGWYDHQRPQLLGVVQGDFERGFRVPLIAVSAFTPPGSIDNNYLDFGAIARFVEQNFGIQRGALGFADTRNSFDLSEFFPSSTARSFVKITSP